mmetsp:Transcript_10713/g.24867  ORF Transcript_10713/g.24867 Transcript_10713/m.24867 type:complete len:211 (-) Transcript_10713:385-1017(-)
MHVFLWMLPLPVILGDSRFFLLCHLPVLFYLSTAIHSFFLFFNIRIILFAVPFFQQLFSSCQSSCCLIHHSIKVVIIHRPVINAGITVVVLEIIVVVFTVHIKRILSSLTLLLPIVYLLLLGLLLLKPLLELFLLLLLFQLCLLLLLLLQLLLVRMLLLLPFSFVHRLPPSGFGHENILVRTLCRNWVGSVTIVSWLGRLFSRLVATAIS